MLRCIVHRVFRGGRNLFVYRQGIQPKTLVHKKIRVEEAKRLPVVQCNKRGAIVRVGAQARRLLVDNCQYTSKSSKANSENVKRLFYGSQFPILAFVGVGLAAGKTEIITKDEQLEGLCWEIRDIVVKVQQNRQVEDKILEKVSSLEELKIDKFISKGCSAAVFAAALKKNDENTANLDEFKRYPLALKMMFNYDIQSDAEMILKAYYTEVIPARQSAVNVDLKEAISDRNHIPAHANIVNVFSAFCAEIPEKLDKSEEYSKALPFELHAEGIGRHVSLFLLMKRYNYSLDKYLKRPEAKANKRISLIIFAQLMEAVAHLQRFGTAHRDLKSDNILIEKVEGSTMPILVITDFGCCLERDKSFNLKYPHNQVNKGGNIALMAPEIINKEHGRFSVLNYSKSDLWAAGTIAYEIFGQQNPFVNSPKQRSLFSKNYKESDLPDLIEVPWLVKKLVQNMLQRNPKYRLNPEVAANVMQLFLWAPTAWLRPANKIPSSDDIFDWLYSLTTKVLCENIFGEDAKSKKSYTEYLLIASFLQRASLRRIQQALLWIQKISRPFYETNYVYSN